MKLSHNTDSTETAKDRRQPRKWAGDSRADFMSILNTTANVLTIQPFLAKWPHFDVFINMVVEL